MGRRDRIRRDSNESGGFPVKLVLLILALVLGIPAIATVVVLVVIFALGFWAAGEARKGVDQFAQEVEAAQLEQAARQKQMQEDAIARQKEFDANFKKKKDPPNLPPLTKIPGTDMCDLIALIDPKKDGGFRNWSIVNNELHCNDTGGLPRIDLPYQPPAEYDFIAQFSQPKLRNGISLIMPNPNGGSFFFYIGGGPFGAKAGSSYGLAAKPKNFDNESLGLIQVNTKYTVTVQVRKKRVRAVLDGNELVNVQTDFRNLTTDGWRTLPNPSLLAVACDDPTVFHQVRVIEVTGVGKRMR